MRFIAGSIMAACAVANAFAFDGPADWGQAQTYGMLSMPPEAAAKHGWTVNGLWTSYGMSDAVRGATQLASPADVYPQQWKYPTVKDYVDACHAAGVLAPATIYGIGDHLSLRQRYPEIALAHCRLADGSVAYYEFESKRHFMCANNELYDDYLIALGKEAIDAGADLIVFDEIQGNELTLYWPNATGFCERCFAAYRNHLRSTFSASELQTLFAIDDLDSVDFVKRLGPQGGKPWTETDALFKELYTLQKRNSFNRAQMVIDALRAHMREVGHLIPVTGNTTEMGLEAHNGFRTSGLQWAQMLDFAVFENRRDHLLPRGKWVASEKLAAAAFPYASAVEIRYAPLALMQQEYAEGKTNRSVYLYGLLAEAYAHGCAFVNYHQEAGLPNLKGLWEDTFRAQQFVLAHRELFEPKATTGAVVAVLYIENDTIRYRTPSYLGLAQALAESSIPFDVITDGGDGFVPVNLSVEKLKPYQLIIVPIAQDILEPQRRAITEYVKGGGIVLTADAASFGLADGVEKQLELGVLATLPAIISNGNSIDLAAAYFMDYSDELRQQLATMVRKHVEPGLSLVGADRAVSAFPRFCPEDRRAVVHVVNSDYQPDQNAMRPKRNLTLRLKVPGFLAAPSEARLFSPDFGSPAREEGLPLEFLQTGEWLELPLPELNVYQLVSLR